jgi:integrase
MASIGKITIKDGSVRYRARWRDPSGQQRAMQFERKADAERHLVHIEHSKQTAAYVDPKLGQRTLRDFGEAWRAGQVHYRERTAGDVERALRIYVYPTFGARAINTIRRSEIQAWVAKLTTTLKPGTVRKVHVHMSSLFKAAIEDGLIATNPCRKVKLPKNERELIHPLTVEQMDALARTVPEQFRALIVTMAGTGLRPSEAFGLTVDRVNFLKRSLRVDRQITSRRVSEVRFGPPKTDASNRVIPVPELVLDALAAHLAAYGQGPQGLIFTNGQGQPLFIDGFYDSGWFRAALRQAGLAETTSLHDLRHFHASLLIAQGADILRVQRRLGHASAQTTLDVYGHLFPDADDRTRDLLDAALAPLGQASSGVVSETVGKRLPAP